MAWDWSKCGVESTDNVLKLDPNKSYVLWWSSGLDSTLLLAKLRDQPVDFAIYTFRQFWTKEQAKKADALIKKWNLKVFSFPAASVNFIGQKDEFSAVFEMPIGTGRTPIIMDLIDGDRCLLSLPEMQMPSQPFSFDVHIVGSRHYDKHYSLQNVVPSERWQANGVEYWAPLFDYSREAVTRELRARGLDDTEADDDTDSNSLKVCHRCIKGTEQVLCPLQGQIIDSVVWDRDYNLSKFREIYG